ncbi:hypothetical protein Tco_1035658 [Tanacetum coccineum]
MSEYDEVEQSILSFNDLFPFNIVYPDDLKLDKDNDDNEIDMIQSSGGNENTHGSNKLLEASHDKINKVFKIKSFVLELNVSVMAWNYLVNGMLYNLIKNLYVPFGIPFKPKRYNKDGDCARMLRGPRISFPPVMRMEDLRIRKWVKIDIALPPRDQRYQYLRYEGLQYTEGIITDFEMRLASIYRREVHRVQVFDFRGLSDLIAKGGTGMLRGRVCSLSKHGGSYSILEAQEMQTASFGLHWTMSVRRIPDKGDLSAYWIGISFTEDFLGTPPSYTLIRDHVLRYLRLFASGRKQGAMISEGQFVAPLAGILVPAGLARQEGDAGGVVEEAPVAPRGSDEDEEMPQAVPPPSRTQGKRITRLEEEVHDMRKALQGQRSVLDSMARDFSRQRTDGASTSTASQQPDP